MSRSRRSTACGSCRICKWAERNCKCSISCGPCQWTKLKCQCFNTDSCGACNWLHNTIGCSCGEYKSCQPHCHANSKCHVDNIRTKWITYHVGKFWIEAVVDIETNYEDEDDGDPSSTLSVRKVSVLKKLGGNGGIHKARKMKHDKNEKRKAIIKIYNHLMYGEAEEVWECSEDDVVKRKY